MTFFFIYLASSWSKVDSNELARLLGSVLLPSTYFGTLWSNGLRLLLLRVVCGPSSLHSWSVLDCPRVSGLSTQTVRRMQDRWPWSGVQSCLPLGASDLSFVWSLPSNHSMWHIWLARITSNDILSLFLLVAHGRTKTFLLVGSNMVTRTGGLSIFTSFLNLNWPSFIADCICRRKTTQSLVLWRKEPCHLQYTRPFNSSTGGIVCDNLILPCLSNSSNILSHLAILNVNLTFPFCVECGWEREKDLALAGQTNSVTCNLFGFWGLGGRLSLCRPSVLGRWLVDSGALDGPTCSQTVCERTV